jgi:hypothetical protein
MSEESNAHKAPPLPDGLARGTRTLLEKRLSSSGLSFDAKAYIDEHGKPCVQVYVDNDDDPDDFLDLHYEVDDDSPDELYAVVREELSEIYEL